MIPLSTEIPSLLLDEGKLTEVISQLPFSAHLRDTGSDKFVLANDTQAKNWGITQSEKMIGMTPRELQINEKKLLSNSISPLLLEQNYMLYNAANYSVEKENKALTFKEATVTFKKIIYCGKNFKWPILNSKGKTIAVFTISIETTRNMDLLKLYALYNKYFPVKIAIDQFLKYLNIKKYFLYNPTHAELIMLLTMRRTSVRKLICQQLNIKQGTVETHIQNLRKNLKAIRLERLLMILRDFHNEKAIFE